MNKILAYTIIVPAVVCVVIVAAVVATAGLVADELS